MYLLLSLSLSLSLSSKLRAALGLSDKSHTPPLYILRMRELGYPPGWRQIQEEYLRMFDEAGQGKWQTFQILFYQVY